MVVPENVRRPLGPDGLGIWTRFNPGWDTSGSCGGTVEHIRCSIVVSISACHAEDPGSIPGGGAALTDRHKPEKPTAAGSSPGGGIMRIRSGFAKVDARN